MTQQERERLAAMREQAERLLAEHGRAVAEYARFRGAVAAAEQDWAGPGVVPSPAGDS